MTELYTREALAFIADHRDRPFFLYLAHAMPHVPYDASPAFRGKSARGLYGDAVEEIDASTGRILEKVRELGLAEKTLVIFTSDNGPERNHAGTAAPLRGTKHTAYEGGLRVPFVAWWPGRIPAGRVAADFIATLDLLPTFARLAGNSALPRDLDGHDISPVLLGEPGAASPRTTLFSLYGFRANRRESMREGNWKLHLGPTPELYDLAADPTESRNVAAEHPARVAHLSALGLRIRESTGAPAVNPYDPSTPVAPKKKNKSTPTPP
jgi:arylsulfatase A-like enzyme